MRRRPTSCSSSWTTSASTRCRCSATAATTPPATPNIDRIADAGIRFRNTWSMPACSTSRAVFFSGRFPLRTNVFGALGPDDLANSMVSPYEMTPAQAAEAARLPERAVRQVPPRAAGQQPVPATPCRTSLGWDYFDGWLDETGDPSSIDTHRRWRRRRRGVLFLRLRAGCRAGRGRQRRLLRRRTAAASAMQLAQGVPPGRTLPRQRRHLRSEPALPESAPGEHRLRDAERALRLAAGHQRRARRRRSRCRRPTRARAPSAAQASVDAADRLDPARSPKNKPWMATRQLRVGAHAGDAAAAGAAALRPGRHQRARAAAIRKRWSSAR